MIVDHLQVTIKFVFEEAKDLQPEEETGHALPPAKERFTS